MDLAYNNNNNNINNNNNNNNNDNDKIMIMIVIVIVIMIMITIMIIIIVMVIIMSHVLEAESLFCFSSFVIYTKFEHSLIIARFFFNILCFLDYLTSCK